MSNNDHPGWLKSKWLSTVETQLKKAKECGDKVAACCPSHDDNNPSFEMKVGTHRLWLKCYAGCSQEQIASALGLPPDGDPKRPRRSKTDTNKKATGEATAQVSSKATSKKTQVPTSAEPKPYKLPNPRKGTKDFAPPKVHRNAKKAMYAVAYGLTQGGKSPSVLERSRPVTSGFPYYVTPELCAFAMCRWDLRESEAKERKSRKVILPIHKVVGGWQSGNQMNADRPLYGLFPRLLTSQQQCGEETTSTGTRCVLYKKLTFENIPDVTDAETVYIVEGEPKVEVLLALGVNAVSPAHGAQAPHQTDWSTLRNAKTIILIPDNDEAGFKFVCKVRGLLAIHAPDATVVVKDLADDRGL